MGMEYGAGLSLFSAIGFIDVYKRQHSRYFSDELGVPNFLLKTEQMFAM